MRLSRCPLIASMPALVLILLSGLTALGQNRTGPFTHEPRSVRSRSLDQHHIRLEMDYDFASKKVACRAVLTAKLFQADDTVRLDAAEIKVEEVRLLEPAEKTLAFKTNDGQLAIELDQEYPAGQELQLAIRYDVESPDHGIHFVDVTDDKSQKPMAWTQNEPEYARYWIPCIDTPADRLTSEVLVTVPETLYVLSNGVLRSKTFTGDGRVRWHWDQREPHVPYLISVVVGEFAAFKQTWRGLPVNAYVPPGRIEDAARSFEKTPQMLEYFSNQVGVRYPWEKYSQICVDEYQWGGMEHTSATTLNVHTLHDERAHLDVSSDNLVAHELIHQWYGNLLTCKDWGEIWLNESFATYFATLWTEHDKGWDEATWERYEEAQEYLEEDKRYRRSIVNYRYNSPENMFDGHSYPKGGRVLHMLRFVLGDEAFWRAIHHYTVKNSSRGVETADLRIAIEEATGQGLNWFFDQWLNHGGHPEFDVRWRWDDEANMVHVQVRQTQKVNAVTPLFHMPVEIELAGSDGSTIHRVEVSEKEEHFHFSADQRPARVSFDPRDWILKTLKEHKSKEEWLDQLAHDEHLMCRVRAAQALAAFDNDQDAAGALINAASQNSFWTVRQEAAKALGKFSGSNVRKALIDVARQDDKSFVRRAAIASLASFKHDTTARALRTVVEQDRSYYAVAEALKSLAKVAAEDSKQDLIAALDQESHSEVILEAACKGLSDLKLTEAAEKIARLLEDETSLERRVLLVGTLAKLKADNDDAQQALYELVAEDDRRVRQRAIEALVDVGDPEAIGHLLEQRSKTETPGAIRALDEAIEKLRGKERNMEQLRQEIETLRENNRQLEERLEKLENSREQKQASQAPRRVR